MEELRFIIYRQYKIVEDDNDWRVVENFGSYRILKKKFKTIQQAKKRIDQMTA